MDRIEVQSRTMGECLASVIRDLAKRGWMPGTAGNGSVRLSKDPLLLQVTTSGVDKRTMSGLQTLLVDGETLTRQSSKLSRPSDGRPSYETVLHREIMRVRDAGAVLHTHSVWGTILSDCYTGEEGVSISGYELLRGLAGVESHLHREEIPIIENSTHMITLAQAVHSVLESRPEAHAFLLRRHGLYTWGANLEQARQHVEVLEFLFEVIGKQKLFQAAGLLSGVIL